MHLWQRLINTPSTDPDDARRHRLLNILLVNLGVCSLVGFILTIITPDNAWGNVPVLCLFSLGTFTLIYFWGRYRSGRFASMALLTLLMVILLLGDTPFELTEGRSTIYFVLPIVMASMLLRPEASFIAAAIVIVSHTILAFSLNHPPNFLTGVIYLLVALVSWLMANSLEQALRDLRGVNCELDQRVSDRTRELREALLREQAEAGKNRAILQSISDSVLVFDPQGRLMIANPTLSRLVGKTLPEMLGKPLTALLGEAVPPQQRKIIEALFEAPNVVNLIQLDYEKKILALSLSPVLLESGQEIGTVAVLRDVTHEAEINRMKNTFMAMVSHELRTPLNAIFGMTEILQQKLYGPLTDRQQDVVTRLMTNTRKLMALIKDLLDHTKIEAGILVVQSVPFSLDELMTIVREATQEIAAAKGVKLVTRIEVGIPEVMLGDLQRLDQILENLVINAIKFTGQGQIQVRFYMFGLTHWAMEVSDTGSGIDSEARSHVFEPFWQADSTIGREYGGVGLGLAIVQSLVSLMDGEIRLESELGVGSTFTVVLPLRLPGESSQ
jgi:PAS domain S-box-containing protein